MERERERERERGGRERERETSFVKRERYFRQIENEREKKYINIKKIQGLKEREKGEKDLKKSFIKEKEKIKRKAAHGHIVTKKLK